MDNKAFENNMINAVNENAKVADTDRITQFQKDMAKWLEHRKNQKRKAITELLCLVLGFFTVVIATGVLVWMDALPGEYSIAVIGVLGLFIGGRVNGLINVI